MRRTKPSRLDSIPFEGSCTFCGGPLRLSMACHAPEEAVCEGLRGVRCLDVPRRWLWFCCDEHRRAGCHIAWKEGCRPPWHGGTPVPKGSEE
jgi:hypothetical protein